MTRRREKIQWRRRMKTWVGRVTTVADDGTLDRGDGWVDLRTDNQELAQKTYERWLETGEPPAQRDKETFGAAVERIMALAKPGKNTSDRLMRLRSYAVPRIGMLPVHALDSGHVSSVLDAMVTTDDKSAGYIAKMRSDLSVVLKRLVREQAIRVNCALGVSIDDNARVDTRLRMNLTDEQYLEFQRSRGFRKPIDLMVMLVREVAGYRTSDLHAGDWQYLDTDGFTWVKVRRPKTDGEVGANVAQRRVRAYQRVEHGIPEHVRPPLEIYWRSLGCPKKGPMFPLLRPGVAGKAKSRHGGEYERRASAVGGFKANGTSYADEFRQAVWDAGIYAPLEGFDPERPDKSKCALQTDTPTTRRLDFMSLRRDYVTAVADSGVNEQTALGLSGHTQLTTQMRHYMKARKLQTPPSALPGKKQGPVQAPISPPPPDDRLATLERMMAEMLALQTAQTRGAAPQRGVEEAPRRLRLVRKSS